MPKAKVWNDSVHDHREMFKGDEIKIPAGKFIEMDFYDGHELKGQFTPVILTGDGRPDERYLKKIRVEEIKEKKTDPVEDHRCQRCKETFSSAKSLDEHIDENHLDDLEDAKVAIDRRKKRAV